MSDEFEGAAAEAAGGRTIEAFGNQYEVADKVALMPMLRFAHLAKKGVDSMEMEAMLVMYDMLRGVFTDEAWERFEQDAGEARADGDDLFEIVKDAIAVISARPTTRPSVSAPGPSTTSESSTEPSSFEERKRALGFEPVLKAV